MIFNEIAAFFKILVTGFSIAASRAEFFFFHNNQLFYKCNFSSVGYLGQGAGDLNIKAQCRLLIQTSNIEDCVLYDNASSDKSSNYTKTSSLSISHDTDHYILSTTTINQFLTIAEDYDNVSFEIEAKLLQPASGGNDPIGLMDKSDSLYNTALMTIELNRTLFLTFINGSYSSTASQTVYKSSSKYYRYVVTVEGSTVNGKVYDGDTLLYNQTITKSLNKKYYAIGLTNNPCTMHVRNIKLKSL